jgi:hypothetical protein
MAVYMKLKLKIKWKGFYYDKEKPYISIGYKRYGPVKANRSAGRAQFILVNR